MECVLQLQLQVCGLCCGRCDARRHKLHPSSGFKSLKEQSKILGPWLCSAPTAPSYATWGSANPTTGLQPKAMWAGLGYVCLQATVLQPPPCVAPGTKPEQAQVDWNHFACHANKTRSCTGPALQLGVR